MVPGTGLVKVQNPNAAAPSRSAWRAWIRCGKTLLRLLNVILYDLAEDKWLKSFNFQDVKTNEFDTRVDRSVAFSKNTLWCECRGLSC